MNTHFGECLEKLIKYHRISIRKLAQDLNISTSTVQEWVGKDGRFPGNPDILRKLAQYFNISLYELLYGEEDPCVPFNTLLSKLEIHTGTYEISIRKVNPLRNKSE